MSQCFFKQKTKTKKYSCSIISKSKKVTTFQSRQGEINPDIKEFKDFTIDDFKLIDYYPDQTKYDIDIAL